MQICDNGVMRDMTAEEEFTANNLPNPAKQVTAEDKAEAFDILMGDVVCAGMTPQEKARQLRPLIEKPLFSLMTLNGGK